MKTEAEIEAKIKTISEFYKYDCTGRMESMLNILKWVLDEN